MPYLDIKEKRRPNENPTPNTKGESKRQDANEGQGSAKSIKFDCLKPSETDPAIEEIPENDVNVATGQINSANALGVGG